MMSRGFVEWFGLQGIQMQTTPAGAHWQLSLPERTIETIKSMLTAMAKTNPEIAHDELLGRCLAAFNDMSKTRGGWSPFQRLISRTPVTCGDMMEEPDNLPLLTAELAAEDEFGINLELRRMARMAFLEAEASQRLGEVATVRHRLMRSFNTGDMVYVWRRSRFGSQKSQMKPTWM